MSDSSLDQLYAAHLTTLDAAHRPRAGGERLRCVGRPLPGRPPLQFLDDQDYPYKVNPQFKAWVPILDNPRCILVYRARRAPHSAVLSTQRFLAQTGADCPRRPWTAAVDLIAMEDDSKAAAHWDKFGRVAFIGPEVLTHARHRPGNASIPRSCWRCLHYDRAVKTPYELACMRKASETGRARPSAALAAFHRGGSEYACAYELSGRPAAARRGDAVQQYRGL